MGCPAHERSEYQVSAKHDWTECLYLDPLHEIEPDEGFVAANARLRPSSPLDPTWRSG
jgi:hypothetical protein